MSDANPKQIKLRREARIFGVLARIAGAVALLSVGAQILAVAAPLWKGGVVTETLLKIATQAILSAPALIYVAGLERARRVFRRISDGDIFTRDNSQSLVAVGATLLVGALWSIAVAGLAPLDQLHHSTNINHELSDIGFAAADIALAALGLALIMIGRVMSAATDLKSENDRFV